MTKASMRISDICAIEGFTIEVYDKTTLKKIAENENGKMGAYPRERATKGGSTVAEFIKSFEDTYPGLTCKVFKKGGEEAIGQTTLSTVRASYQSIN